MSFFKVRGPKWQYGAKCTRGAKSPGDAKCLMVRNAPEVRNHHLVRNRGCEIPSPPAKCLYAKSGGCEIPPAKCFVCAKCTRGAKSPGAKCLMVRNPWGAKSPRVRNPIVHFVPFPISYPIPISYRFPFRIGFYPSSFVLCPKVLTRISKALFIGIRMGSGGFAARAQIH